MRKRKRQLTTLDWAQIPTVVPKRVEGYQTREESKAAFEREEQEAREKPIRDLENTLQNELRANEKRLKAFWSLPIPELQNYIGGNAMPVDVLVAADAPTRTEPLDKEQCDAILREFWLELRDKHKCELSEDAWSRIGLFVGSLTRTRELQPTIALWFAALDRLYHQLEAFHSGEVSGKVPKVERPETQTAQPLPDSRSYQESISTRDIRWKKIVDQGWSSEFAKWFVRWTDSLKDNFNFDFPVDELGMKVANYLQKWNLSPFVHKSWDKVRVSSSSRDCSLSTC